MNNLKVWISKFLSHASRAIYPGSTGAVGVFRTVRTPGSSSGGAELIVGSATWLVILSVLIMYVASLILGPERPFQKNNLLVPWVLAYIIYSLILRQLALNNPGEYESTRFRWLRIEINIIMITILILITSGAESPFWVFYCLPLFATIIYTWPRSHQFIVAFQILIFYSIASWLAAERPPELSISWLIVLFNSATIFFIAIIGWQLFRFLRGHSQADYFEGIIYLRNLVQSLDPVAELEKLEKDLIRQAVVAVGAERGTLMLINHKEQLLEHLAIYPPGTVDGHHQFKIGHGIAGCVAVQQKAYRSSDATQHQSFIPPAHGMIIKSVLAVPLVSRNRTVGVLCVDSPKEDVFSDQHEMILLTYASLTADKIAWARTLRSLRTLRETPYVDLNETLATILDQLEAQLGFDSATIFLIDKDEATVQAQTGHRNPEMVRQVSLSLSETLFSQMSSTRRPIVISDARHDERMKGLGGTDYVRGWLATPLIARNEIVGCITVDSTKAGAFTEADGQLVSIFADHAALAIQDAQIYSHLQSILAATRTIVSEVSVAELAMTLVEPIRLLSKAEACVVVLCELQTQHPLYIVADLKGRHLAYENLSYHPNHAVRDWVLAQQQSNNGAGSEQPFGQQLGISIKDLLVFPLVAKGKEIGGMIVINKETGAFTAYDEVLLEPIMTTIAAAFLNCFLYEMEKEKSLILETLAQASTDISRQLPNPKLPDSIIAGATELVQAKGGAVYLLERPGFLTLTVAQGLDKAMEGTCFPIGNSAAGKALETRRSVQIHNYTSWPYRLPFLEKYSLATVLAVPLYWGNQPLGAIAVHDDRPGRVFTPEQVEALETFANHAAIVIKHSQDLSELDIRNRNFEDVLDKARDGIAILDQRGRIVKLNPAAENLLGYSQDEAIHMAWTQFFANRHDARQVLRYVIHDRSLTDHYTTALSKKRERIPVLLSAVRLSDGFGSFFSDRRLVKNARDELALLRAVFEVATGIDSTTGLQSMLGKLVDKTRIALGCKNVLLYLYNEVQEAFEVPPVHSGVKHLEPLEGVVKKDSILHKILADKKIRFFGDVRSDPLTEGLAFPERENTSALVACPLLSDNREIGVLLCNYREPMIYGVQENRIIDSFTKGCAMAILRAQDYARREFRERQQAAFDMVGRIGSSDSLDAAFDTILDAITHAVGCQKAAIFYYDRDKNVLDLRSNSCLSAHYVQSSQNLPIEPNSRTTAILQDEPIIVKDIKRDRNFGHLAYLAAQEGFQAFIEVRLHGKDGPIGTLAAYFDRTQHFTRDTIDFFRLFALKVQDAWQLNKANQYVSALTILRRLLADLTVTQAHETIMFKKATRLIHELFNYDMIALGGWADNFLVFNKTAIIGINQHLPEVIQLPVTDLAASAITSGKPQKTTTLTLVPLTEHFPTSLRSAIVVPLKVDASTFGLLVVCSSHRHAFTPEATRLLEVVGRQVALALQLARAFNEFSKAEERQMAIEQAQWITSWGSYLAHELRNAAGVLPSVLQKLADQDGDLDFEQDDTLLKDDLWAAYNSAKHLLLLANELDRAAAAGSTHPVHVQTAIDEALTIANVSETAIELTVHIPPDLPYVSAVPSFLKEIFLHIIRNAIQHGIPDGGTLAIKGRLSSSQNQVVIEFADNGRGMSDSVKRRAFIPNFRPGKNNFGISLYIDRLHARKWSGDIVLDWERTQPLLGSVFFVKLKVERSTSLPTDSILPASQAIQREYDIYLPSGDRSLGNVLIVDDYENWRSFLRSLFTQRGFRAFTAPSPLSATVLAAKKTINLAIVDINLSGPDETEGLRLARSLYEQDPDTVIVLLTAFKIPEEAKRLKDQGIIFDIIVKGSIPVLDIDAFETALDAMLAAIHAGKELS